MFFDFEIAWTPMWNLKYDSRYDKSYSMSEWYLWKFATVEMFYQQFHYHYK